MPRLNWSNRAPLMIFAGLSLLYLALSPGSVWDMGYTRENIRATHQILSWLGALFAGAPAPSIDWPRHGILELLIESPFVLASRLLFGASENWAGRVLSLQPVMATSFLSTLVFVWVRRITLSSRWAYVLALGTGLGTMLWPYAYIGLETNQSLFLLLAAYLALGAESGLKNWGRTLAFGLCCGLAVSLKINGAMLAPAAAFLAFSYFRSGESNAGRKGKRLAIVVTAVVSLFAVNVYTQSLFFERIATSRTEYTLSILVNGPVEFAIHVLSFFGSPNKSLFVYAPITALALFALPRAFRVNRGVTLFALLTLGGLVAGCSLLLYWSDETWGPRYLHSAVAPLAICLAAAKESATFRLRREIPLVALLLAGFFVSFLGSFFYYGRLHFAATATSRQTIETLQYNPNWNHIRFNWRLLNVWVRQALGIESGIEPWPPPDHWWFSAPPGGDVSTFVDLRDYSQPQPLMFQKSENNGVASARKFRLLRAGLIVAFVSGIWLLIKAGHKVFNED